MAAYPLVICPLPPMMLSIFWVAFLVGGTFVALSLFGGHGSDADVGHDFDAGHDLGHDTTLDLGHDTPTFDLDHTSAGDVDAGHVAADAPSAGFGLSDLLSLRFAFLFSAFFGLTGLALTYGADEVPAFIALVAVLVGLVVGLGGQVALRKMAEDRVSSDVTTADLIGRTGRVVVPMAGDGRGQIRVVSKGSVVMLPARVVAGAEAYGSGDEVVIVRMDGRTAEVVRPDRGDEVTAAVLPRLHSPS